MLFESGSSGVLYCYDWCDHIEDDRLIGVIIKSPKDGFFRFSVVTPDPLSCRNLKLAAAKLSELNKGVIKV